MSMRCYLLRSLFSQPCQADGCWMLMERSWTTVMTVRSDGCTRRHMSVLRSSNVWLKLLLCVNKEDRKWQFGSSNQECHSQLRPLPAPDTSRGLKRSWAWLLFFCYPLPFLSFPPLLSPFLQDIPFQSHLRDAKQSRGRQNDVRKTRVGATAAHFLNTPIKHEACLVRLPWHPLSKSQPCLAEAEKQMSWVSLPLLDRAVKIYPWRTLKTAQMERRSYLRFNLFICQKRVSWWKTINSEAQTSARHT